MTNNTQNADSVRPINYDFGPIPDTMPTVADCGGEATNNSPDPVYLALWRVEQLLADEELGAGECVELIADVVSDFAAPAQNDRSGGASDG